eukprot:sb/3467659/
MQRVPSWKTCVRCGVPGHTERWCPDKWRQYHSTTTHAAPECNEEAPEDSLYLGSQLVVQYDTNSIGLAQQKKRKIKRNKNAPSSASNNPSINATTEFSDTVFSDTSAKNSVKKKRSNLPRSKSLAFPSEEKSHKDKVKRRSKSLEDVTKSGKKAGKETNLSKFKSLSHKSLDNSSSSKKCSKDDAGGEAVKQPKKFNKVKEELEKLQKSGKKGGKNKNNKNNDKSKQVTASPTTDNYGYNRNNPMPNQNHVTFETSRSAKQDKSKKGGKKKGGKNKNGGGFQRTVSVFA